MTSIIKAKSFGEMYVCMEIVHTNDFCALYHVGLYEYCKVVKENSYPITMKKRALSCYYRYCREAKGCLKDE